MIHKDSLRKKLCFSVIGSGPTCMNGIFSEQRKTDGTDSLFQITWTRQLDPGGANVSLAGQAEAVGELGRDEAGSPALAIVSAAGKYEILTVAEMTHISDDRFIITSAAVNNVSKRDDYREGRARTSTVLRTV